MDVARAIEVVDGAGRRLAGAAKAAGVDAAVPACPGWTVRDLLAHTGGVHRWATSYLVSGRERETTADEEAVYFAAPPGDGLVTWFEAGHASLVAALRAAPRTLRCWTFLPAASSLEFWARRQAHETAVHCADAEASAGCTSTFPSDVAADGIDELLCGFFSRPNRGPTAEAAVTLGVVPADAGLRWTVTIGPDGARTPVR